MNPSATNPIAEGTFLSSKFLNPDYLFSRLWEIFKYLFTERTLEVIYVVLAVLAIFFIAVIIYATVRMFEIREKEHEHLHREIEEYAHNQALKKEKEKETGPKNRRWENILNYLFSNNENDWKQAILEADTMLFDLLTELGFQGETLGDKLKNVNTESFRSLDSAWEVHNIRNRIAHEGSAFSFSLHETKRVIALYEQIFRDFGYI